MLRQKDGVDAPSAPPSHQLTTAPDYNGGNIVVTGTPEQVSNHISSHTGKYLKSKLVLSQTIRKSKSGLRT
jgi:hypothetical protein